MKISLLGPIWLPSATLFGLCYTLHHESQIDSDIQKAIAVDTANTCEVHSSSEYLGCFFDDNDLPTLSQQRTIYDDNDRGDDDQLSTRCTDVCRSEGYKFAGLRRNEECWCGNFIGNDLSNEQSDCNISCPASSTETCSASDRIRIYMTTHEVAVSMDDRRPGELEREDGGFIAD
jgi:hypothetical protein